MASSGLSMAIFLVAIVYNATAAEVPSQSALCKATRIATLKRADKPLQAPDVVLNKEQYEVVTNERVCLKSYGITFPGGVEGLINATSDEIKEDLDKLTKLSLSAKGMTFSNAQLTSLIEELSTQKNVENKTLSEKNRTLMRLKYFKDGTSSEQFLLWGHHYYMWKLYQEKKYKAILDNVVFLKNRFKMDIGPHAWDEAETHSYFSIQSLKNMTAILEFRARAKIAGRHLTNSKAVLEDFLKNRPILFPAFKAVGGDPTSEIREQYCAVRMQKG